MTHHFSLFSLSSWLQSDTPQQKLWWSGHTTVPEWCRIASWKPTLSVCFSAFVSVLWIIRMWPESDRSDLRKKAAQHQYWHTIGPKRSGNDRKRTFIVGICEIAAVYIPKQPKQSHNDILNNDVSNKQTSAQKMRNSILVTMPPSEDRPKTQIRQTPLVPTSGCLTPSRPHTRPQHHNPPIMCSCSLSRPSNREAICGHPNMCNSGIK